MTEAPHVLTETPVRVVARVDGHRSAPVAGGECTLAGGRLRERLDAGDGALVAVDHRWRGRLARQGVGDRPWARLNARLNASSES